MLSLFELAVSFMVMMICINGMFAVFGLSVAGLEFEYDSVEEMIISDAEVDNLSITSENSVKEGDIFAAIFSFISVAVGTVTGSIGAISIFLQPFFAFGNAWAYVLGTIFKNTGLLWDFLSVTVVPFINFMQVGSIAYIIMYAVAAIRGANA